MSDLKFRAWHKERNKMLDVFGINFRTPATAQVLNDEYNHYEGAAMENSQAWRGSSQNL